MRQSWSDCGDRQATGYQDSGAEDARQVKLRAFLSEEMRQVVEDLPQ